MKGVVVLLALFAIPSAAAFAARGRHAPYLGGNVVKLSFRCKAGVVSACAALGHALVYGEDTSQNLNEGVRHLEEACKKRSVLGCFFLAQVVEDEKVSRGLDPERVVRLYRDGCNRKHAWSCAFLAKKLAQGYGVAQDVKRAAKMFGETCESGIAEACSIAAEFLLRGIGAKKDQQEAGRLLERGCKDGDAKSCDGRKRLPEILGDGLRRSPY